MSARISALNAAPQPIALAPLIGGLSRTLGILAVLAMILAINTEIVSRTLFGHATIWVTEVSTYLVVAITFLGAAHVALRDGHVRVDLVINRLSPARRAAMLAGLTWLSAFLTLALLWKATGFLAENFHSQARSWSLLSTPLWIPQLAMVLGLAALAIALALQGAGQARPLAALPFALALAYALLAGLGLLAGPPPLVSIGLLAGLTLISAALSQGLVALSVLAVVVLPAVLIFWASIGALAAAKSLVLVATLFFLLFTGLPVTFCLLGIGILAMAIWLPPVSLGALGERGWMAVNTFELASIPMFVLMGAILVRSNASTEMFRATRYFMGSMRGSLAHASIIASGIFAAVSGSSLATAATMGRLAGPEMMDQGYRPELAYGVLAAGGTLGILIPPSIAMIIYGPMAGVPVTELFMAGIVPGLAMIAAFSLTVAIWLAIDSKAAPRGSSVPWREKLAALWGVAPFVILMVMVLGSLYAGIATPTEAGAVGVLGAFVISLARGTMTLTQLIAALEETVTATSFLLMIAVGAAVMGFAIDYLSMPQMLVQFVQGLGLSDLALFLTIVALYFLLGMFVEPISMVLMTLPVVLPVIAAAGWDPLWFGIILVMLVEIGLITPPVGMILYVLSGVSDSRVSLTQISAGALPFVGVFLLMIFLFYAFPQIVTFLPVLMR